jgi:hypothetical protein
VRLDHLLSETKHLSDVVGASSHTSYLPGFL